MRISQQIKRVMRAKLEKQIQKTKNMEHFQGPYPFPFSCNLPTTKHEQAPPLRHQMIWFLTSIDNYGGQSISYSFFSFFFFLFASLHWLFTWILFKSKDLMFFFHHFCGIFNFCLVKLRLFAFKFQCEYQLLHFCWFQYEYHNTSVSPLLVQLLGSFCLKKCILQLINFNMILSFKRCGCMEFPKLKPSHASCNSLSCFSMRYIIFNLVVCVAKQQPFFRFQILIYV